MASSSKIRWRRLLKNGPSNKPGQTIVNFRIKRKQNSIESKYYFVLGGKHEFMLPFLIIGFSNEGFQLKRSGLLDEQQQFIILHYFDEPIEQNEGGKQKQLLTGNQSG